MVDNILKLISIRTNKPILYLYENIVWPLQICFTFDGIDSIKEALINGKQFATDNISIIYKSLGAPLYECIIYTYNENDGIYLMNESLNEVQNTIEKNGGSYILEKKPYVVYPKNNKF